MVSVSRDTQNQVQKQQEPKPKGWVATILDKHSFPPAERLKRVDAQNL